MRGRKRLILESPSNLRTHDLVPGCMPTVPDDWNHPKASPTRPLFEWWSQEEENFDVKSEEEDFAEDEPFGRPKMEVKDERSTQMKDEARLGIEFVAQCRQILHTFVWDFSHRIHLRGVSPFELHQSTRERGDVLFG